MEGKTSLCAIQSTSPTGSRTTLAEWPPSPAFAPTARYHSTRCFRERTTCGKRKKKRGGEKEGKRERKKQQEGKPTRKIEYQLKTWRSLRRDNVTRYVAGRGMRHLVARSVARNGVGWHELGLARAYELPRRCDPTVLLGATCSLLCAISVSCVAT